MKKQRLHKYGVICLTLVLISIGLSGGCINNDSDDQTLLRGWVTATEPVADASLSIYDIDGNLIYHSDQPVTSDFGSFLNQRG